MDHKHEQTLLAMLYAILAACFYAINMPFSKILLGHVSSTIMAGLLYLGAGLGIGLMFLTKVNKIEKEELLSKKDFPYTLGMIVLDILAPVFLMYGLSHTTSANASLLNNFEIVATAVIAFIVFKEAVSKPMWFSIFLITLSSIILSFENLSGLRFSAGSVFIILAAICWGFENNCTRNISSKNTYEIVMLKGLCSGSGSLIIGFILGESLPQLKYVCWVMLLGFVAYGLSILFYIRAQKDLGATKTSAYYAIAPFIGALLSFMILHEKLSIQYVIALVLMLAGSAIATWDMLTLRHTHTHTHVIVHTHDGTTHTHKIVHSHEHSHFLNEENHQHQM